MGSEWLFLGNIQCSRFDMVVGEVERGLTADLMEIGIYEDSKFNLKHPEAKISVG
jgi:hypothetical protein